MSCIWVIHDKWSVQFTIQAFQIIFHIDLLQIQPWHCNFYWCWQWMWKVGSSLCRDASNCFASIALAEVAVAPLYEQSKKQIDRAITATGWLSQLPAEASLSSLAAASVVGVYGPAASMAAAHFRVCRWQKQLLLCYAGKVLLQAEVAVTRGGGDCGGGSISSATPSAPPKIRWITWNKPHKSHD